MRAIRISHHGGPEVLGLEEISAHTTTPTNSPVDYLTLRVDIAGVNFIDVYHRRGQYPVILPSGIGIEGIGTTESGERFFWLSALGSYAEKITVPLSALTPLPDNSLPDEDLLPLLCQGLTAHYLVDSAYSVSKGDVALVTAAVGGVGLILIQLLKARGAKVIALTSSQERVDRAIEHGADSAGLYDEMEKLVHNLTGDNGVNVVYDSVGKDTFDRSLALLGNGGMFVLYGGASGLVPSFDLMRLNSKSLAIRRPTLATYTTSVSERTRRLQDLLSLRERGLLRYPSATVFPLAEAAKAHTLLESRNHSGKIGLAPWKI